MPETSPCLSSRIRTCDTLFIETVALPTGLGYALVLPRHRKCLRGYNSNHHALPLSYGRICFGAPARIRTKDLALIGPRHFPFYDAAT